MDKMKFIYLPATDSIIATYLVADNLGLTKDVAKMRKVYKSILEDFGVDASFLDEAKGTSGIEVIPFEEWKDSVTPAEEEASSEEQPEAEAEAPPETVQLKEKPKPGPAKAPKKEPAKKTPGNDGPRKTNTLQGLMAQHNLKMTCESFRTILTTQGILEIVAIPGGAGRIYRKLTEEGLIYGKNLRKDDGYKVRYYEDMFEELIKLVKSVQEKTK